jgi:hypothetical protein
MLPAGPTGARHLDLKVAIGNHQSGADMNHAESIDGLVPPCWISGVGVLPLTP